MMPKYSEPTAEAQVLVTGRDKDGKKYRERWDLYGVRPTLNYDYTHSGTGHTFTMDLVGKQYSRTLDPADGQDELPGLETVHELC